jgi:L-idonate 5-dehydrogenase
MKAIVIHAPGDVRYEEFPTGAPGDGEVAVRVAAGGICGSDLHYYRHGGFGDIRIKGPMVLGHEVAGEITALGPNVDGLAVGDRVAVNPSRACGRCEWCLAGMANHCSDMRFYGSAMRWPHVDGAFRDSLVCRASQCVPARSGVSDEELALAEPFAVALHALNVAGNLMGRRVLVLGSGPIGALHVAAARHAGAAEIVVGDIADAPLAVATALGADRTINLASAKQELARYAEGKGSFDVLFECVGNAAALAGAISTLRPGGVVVQVGLGGEFALPHNAIVAREAVIKGAFRFKHEFADAVRIIDEQRVNLRPLLTGVFAAAQAREAFEAAGDRSQHMKVQLRFQ